MEITPTNDYLPNTNTANTPMNNFVTSGFGNAFQKTANYVRFAGTSYNMNETNMYPMNSSLNMAKKISQIHQQIEYEEKEFFIKLNKYRELFEKGMCDELEDYIDYNNTGPGVEFKFNFTFDRYRFGNNETAYVVRCIDTNKNDLDVDDENSEENGRKESMLNIKEEILKSFKHLVELYPEEKGEMNNYPNEFLTMTLENKNFQKLINIKKEEINKYSRIHGTNNKETIQEDENSSQASQSGFNDDLCKRNRIEEIRANTLKSISNFYTLNYIRLIVIV